MSFDLTLDHQNSMGQCHGITKKGERCRIQVPEKTKFCRYHVPNATVKNVPKQVKTTSIYMGKSIPYSSQGEKRKLGLIYLYTLQDLVDPMSKKQNWVQIHKSGNKFSKKFDPRTKLLMKIGFTTVGVMKRLQQWEKQCGHHISLVNPYDTWKLMDPMSLMIQNFTRLGLKTVPKFRNFKFEELGFQCDSEPLEIERQIHLILREKYGFSHVYCQGCSVQKNDFNVHLEWFLIPRKDVDKIFKIIDKVITINRAAMIKR